MFHDMLMSARLPADDRWVPAENEGALILFYPTELKEAVATPHGTSDAVLCKKIVNLESGVTYEDVLVFGAGLVVNIREGVPDRMVLGRLGKTNRGAWVLLPHTEVETQLADRHTPEETA